MLLAKTVDIEFMEKDLEVAYLWFKHYSLEGIMEKTGLSEGAVLTRIGKTVKKMEEALDTFKAIA